MKSSTLFSRTLTETEERFILFYHVDRNQCAPPTFNLLQVVLRLPVFLDLQLRDLIPLSQEYEHWRQKCGDQAPSGGIAALSNLRLTQFGVVVIGFFNSIDQPFQAFLELCKHGISLVLVYKVTAAWVQSEPTFYFFKIHVFFGCLGIFLYFCLQPNNHQNWEEKQRVFTMSGGYLPNLALDSSYVFGAESFFR